MSTFTPSVVAPLEEWDNITDVIVWLIEQKEALQISKYADLVLEQMPEHIRGNTWEFLETQSADLDGYISGEGKVRFSFTATYRDNISDNETGEDMEGYEVTVTKRYITEYKRKTEKFATYIVLGCDRDEFKIVAEKVEAVAASVSV